MSRRRSHYFAAVRHPREPKVLLLRSDRRWRLPHATDDETWVANAKAIVPLFERRLGTPLWLLRLVDAAARMFELELRDSSWHGPAHGRWIGSAELASLPLVDDHHRPVLAVYLDALDRDEAPPQRPPWARPGWRAMVRSWLDAELARLGRRFVRLEQVKQWSISSVLRIETDGGDLYFKVSAPLPLFADEAVVTARLAERFPGYVPEPVAVEPERSWILFRPFDVLGWDAPLAERAELFRRFAELQLQTVDVTSDLLADGCLDRRLPVLESHVDELLRDRAALHRLSAAEVRKARSLAPRLHELCRRLEALELPPTLVHGDLHPGNTMRLDGALAYFDWTDACVAHPFVDLHTLQWQRREAERAALLDAYLQPWRAVASEDTLRDAVELARAVTPLHHAVSYSTIANAIEPSSKPELDVTHEFVREAISRARAVSSGA